MERAHEKALGQNIRRLRLARRLSQEQLAAQLQVRGCDITTAGWLKSKRDSAMSILTNCLYNPGGAAALDSGPAF